MASPLIINREPYYISPAYGDLTFEVISTNNTQAQFKYVFDLYTSVNGIDTLINTSKLYPDPNGFARYNPNKILQSYLYPTNINEISSRSYAYQGETLTYYIIFKEEYIYNNVLTTYIRINGSPKYVWMAAPDWEDGKDLTTYTEKFLPNSSNHTTLNSANYLGPKKYVATYGPDSDLSYSIRPTEKRTLSLLTKGMTFSYKPSKMVVITKTTSGSSKQFEYDFTISNLNYDQYLMIHQPVGISELNSISWATYSIPTGLSASITPYEDISYMIWFSTSSLINITHKAINFEIDTCTRFDHYTVMYQTSEGGWWYIPMNMKSYNNLSIEQSTMDTFLPYNYSYNSSQTKITSIKSRGEITLNSNIIANNYEIEEYMDMIKSPTIYLIDKNNKYIPVIVKPGTYIKPNVRIEKNYSFTIVFVEAYNKNTVI